MKSFDATIIRVVRFLGIALVSAAPAAAQPVWSPVGPDNASVFTLAPSPHVDGEILLGTFFGGMYRTRDRGIQWHHIASPFSSASVFAIAYHPSSPGTLYVGTFSEGLYKSSDDGASWMKIDGVPDSTISDVAVDPESPHVVLVASNAGVFRSVDGESGWTETTGGLGLSARTIAFDPLVPARVYVGTRGQGVYRSIDGGQTWAPFLDGLGNREVTSLSFSADGSTLYAATTDGGAFASSGGTTPWNDLSFDLADAPVNQVVEHAGDGRLFAATALGVFTLSPGETTWRAWTARPSRLVLIDAPENLIYVAALGSEFVATVDDGQTFFDIDNGIQNLFGGALSAVDVGGESVIFGGTNNGVHITSRFFEQDGELPWFEDAGFDEVVFVLVPHPSELGTLFAGTERTGVWKSTDWGVTWHPASDGILPPKIFALSQSPVGDQTLYAGTNNGLYVSRDDGLTWSNAPGFDVSVQLLDVLADPVLPGVGYFATDDGRILKTVDDGRSFQLKSVGLPGDPVLHLGAAPFGNIYAVTASGTIYVSSDEGDEWFLTGSDVAEPVISIATHPSIPWKAFVGTNGGGVYRTASSALSWEQANDGLDIPFVFSLAVDPNDGDVVYAGSVDTVYKSVDGGDQWTAYDTGLPAGFVQELQIDDDDSSILYAFIAGAGVFVSSDGGQTWSASVTGAPFEHHVPLAASHQTVDKLFAGSDIEGVWASSDGGVSYQHSSDGMTLFVRGLDIGSQDADVLFAGSLGGGMFKSTDGAGTWSSVGLRDRNIFNVAIHPTQDDIVYAATSLGVVKTLDGGASWLELGQKASVNFSMVVDPADRDRIFIGSSAGNVYRSVDAGQTWTRVSAGLPLVNILALAIAPADGTLYASAERVGVYRSTDDGTSWQPTDPATIGSFQVLGLTVDASGVIYAAAGDAGLYRSTDGGDSWHSINSGFAGDVASQVLVEPSSGTLFAAAQNTPGNFAGVSRSTDGGDSWINASAGLSVESVESLTVDPNDAAKLYAATPAGVHVSTDSGASWSPANSGIDSIEVSRVLVDPDDSSVLLAATHGSGVFRTSNGGAAWEASDLGFAGVDASRLAHGSSPGSVYLTSVTNGFFHSDDFGTTWNGGIDPRLAEPIATFLAIHAGNPDIVFAAASGVGLLRTTDGGLTWQIVGEEIGNPFILAIALSPSDPDTIYVGTSGSGVWVSEDAGDTWAPLNDGLFNPNVTSLVVDPADPNIIYVGTEGGGMFSLDRTPPPVDTDGDGVTDALDCAPGDPRLATIHTFYNDHDLDSFGIPRVEPRIPPDFGIETAVDVCRLAPGIDLVPWPNDPWDFDGFEYGPTVEKNDRILAMDFGATSENGLFPDDALIDVGADATTLHLVWSDLETAPGSFDGPQAATLALANQVLAPRDLKLSLTVSPVVSGLITAPPDLAPGLASGSLSFADPAVIDRFSSLLTHIHSRLPDVEVISLQFGYEIDELVPSFPSAGFWNGYVAFQAAVRDHAESLWGADILTSSIWSAEGFLDPNLDPLRALMDTVDEVLSLTYFPRRADFTIYEPIETTQQLADIAEKAFPRKISFQAIGFPSAPITGSSTTKQAQFLYGFFEFWDQLATEVIFASFGAVHDLPRARAEDLADSPIYRSVGAANRERLVRYLSSLGWRTYPGDGEHKPGFDTLRNHVLNRGWFRDVDRSTRPYYLGFTEAPYDFPPDAADQQVVSDWMRGHFETDADITMIHLDGGVPWVEALADDFSTAELPYSEGVRGSLLNNRATIRPGHKTAVSISPLGVPRHLLAPYWGVGEGFDFDEDFNRIPNGVFADDEQRALPSPWDTYDFDTPEVRIAFLNYARRIIQYFDPDYLVIGIEVSAALVHSQEKYEKYFEMHQWVYSQLKTDPRYLHVPIMVSFSATSYMVDEFGDAFKKDEQLPGVRDAQIDALRRFLPYTDIIGLSHYPHFSRWNAFMLPAIQYDELFRLLDEIGAADKPIAFTEGGYTADEYDILDSFLFLGTHAKQERHYRLLFRELHRREAPVEFIINFKIRDSDLGWQRRVDALDPDAPAGSANFVEFLQFFRDIGIYDGDGALRPAGVRWLQELGLPRVGTVVPGSEVLVTSASGDLEVQFHRDATDRLAYSLERGDETLVGSELGITIDGIDLGRNVTRLIAGPATTVEESFPMHGARELASTRYTELTLTAEREGPGDPAFQLEVRLYDEALAYRYVIPGTGARTVTTERAEWSFPPDTRVWYQDDPILYEGSYRSESLGAIDSAIGGPVTLQLPRGDYVVLTEANVANYSGLSFVAEGAIASKIRGRFLVDEAWDVEGETATPWRVVLTSPNLATLVGSDAVASLNEPPDAGLFPEGASTAWIRPGRALFSIWADPGSGFSYETQRSYVDSAHALGFDYVVVGSGWEIGFPFFGFVNAFDAMANLVLYARSEGRDVGIFAWKSLAELENPIAREFFLDAMESVGAAGVVVDVLAAETQQTNALIETLLADAAERELLVALVNGPKPGGESRTYPNLLTREAVRGLELNLTADDNTPEHNAILPFTRLLAGGADYRPVTLDSAELGMTTVAHQLALAGVLTSPLQTWSVRPELVLAVPEIMDVVQAMPASWSETRVLEVSSIGNVVAFARRTSDTWFLFAINGSADEIRDLGEIALSFLDEGDYRAVTIESPSPTVFDRVDIPSVDAGGSLSIVLPPGGGFVGMFTPETP